jgi:hypothetical protein
MKTIKRGFYHRTTGTVLRGTPATKEHEDLLKKCNMDLSQYIEGSNPKPSKKPAKKADE